MAAEGLLSASIFFDPLGWRSGFLVQSHRYDAPEQNGEAPSTLQNPKWPCRPPSREPFLCLNSQQELSRSTCSPFRKKVKLKGKPRCRLEINWKVSEGKTEHCCWNTLASSLMSVMSWERCTDLPKKPKTSLTSAPLEAVVGRSLRPLSAPLMVTFDPLSFLFVAGGTGVTKLLMTGRQ
ncbi:hypothetical protein EYF80_020542 [Liparis tanakae]|uniref:Uncharacterized protein n=1 Tax=Liparis tanakae TaxID=230148 RepID=A0A4Z2HVA4_9TELE|nr:hypothetical protein EYF80_020542 [Liparis tanakae]